MTTCVHYIAEWGWRMVAAAVGAGLLTGCAGRRPVEPVRIPNRTLGPMTIAVAPALNLSGSTDFDRDRFADAMAVELAYVDGISVIPVSRVLGVLADEGVRDVNSPEHAHEVVRALGADAILVFAVTEYDPHDPPRIGISAQLYGTIPNRNGPSTLVDPVALSRQSRLQEGSDRTKPNRGILAQHRRVFDADHKAVSSDIRGFAKLRGADESPYGWRKYVVSQEHFIQFCCNATLRGLFTGAGETEDASGGG